MEMVRRARRAKTSDPTEDAMALGVFTMRDGEFGDIQQRPLLHVPVRPSDHVASLLVASRREIGDRVILNRAMDGKEQTRAQLGLPDE